MPKEKLDEKTGFRRFFGTTAPADSPLAQLMRDRAAAERQAQAGPGEASGAPEGHRYVPPVLDHQATAERVANIQPNDAMMATMAQVDLNRPDIISDAEAAAIVNRRRHEGVAGPRINPLGTPGVVQQPQLPGAPRRPVPAPLPRQGNPLAVTGEQALAMGQQALAQMQPRNHNPAWMAVRNLPGFALQGLRAMGREAFGPHTRMPLEDIIVIANFGGRGPHQPAEINAVAAAVRQHGRILDRGQSVFQGQPNYRPHYVLIEAFEMQFLLVSEIEHQAQYIYSWPAAMGADRERMLAADRAGGALQAPPPRALPQPVPGFEEPQL